MVTPSRPDNFLPLKPLDLLILLALVPRERHGYGLLQDIEASTEGKVSPDAGNLYRSMRRLLEAKLVQRSERRSAPESEDERRRYYRLTGLGRRVATAEVRRLNGLLELEAARKLLAEAPP